MPNHLVFPTSPEECAAFDPLTFCPLRTSEEVASEQWSGICAFMGSRAVELY